MSVIYISGSEFDIGAVRNIAKANTKMSVLLPGISDGEAPELLKLGEDYITYNIDCRFYGTTTEQNTFETSVKNYCKAYQECVFVNPGEALGSGIDCVFYDWKCTLTNQYLGYRDFNIVLIEAGTIIV